MTYRTLHIFQQEKKTISNIFRVFSSKTSRYYRKGLIMIYIKLNAIFDNAHTGSKDSYTLCGKSDIPPLCIYSNPLAPPNIADALLPRNPSYPHLSYILPGPFNHITYPNNGWAWVYDSNNQTINLPIPCYWDILAENNSNGIKTLAHLINYIGQYNNIQDVYLPNQIEVLAMFKHNNINYSLYILANYNPIQCQSIAHHFYITAFDADSPQLTTQNIQLSNAANIIKHISYLIDSFQQTYQTKVMIYNINVSNKLMQQPI